MYLDDKALINDFKLPLLKEQAFTNIVKNIGYTLCEKCKPDNSKLAETLLALEIKIASKTVKPLKNISKLKNDPKRFSNAIGNLLNSTFGRINEIDKNEIIQYIKLHSSLAVKRPLHES